MTRLLLVGALLLVGLSSLRELRSVREPRPEVHTREIQHPRPPRHESSRLHFANRSTEETGTNVHVWIQGSNSIETSTPSGSVTFRTRSSGTECAEAEEAFVMNSTAEGAASEGALPATPPPLPAPAPSAFVFEPVSNNSVETLRSDWKIDPEQARIDLEARLGARLAEWLGTAGVSRMWKPDAVQVAALTARPVSVAEDVRDYATLYRAEMQVNLSPDQKHLIVGAYRRHLAGVWLGGGLVFLLAGLGIVAGYIRADEATKGYYTNKLRLAAAGGLGAAAVLLGRWILMAS